MYKWDGEDGMMQNGLDTDCLNDASIAKRNRSRKCKVARMLKDEAYLVCDGEKCP